MCCGHPASMRCFDGCLVCDLQARLREYADGTGLYPAWIDTEAKRDAAALADIRAIRDLLTLSPQPREVPCG